MGKKKTETKETARATTTPNVPDWITGPMKEYLARVGRFGGGDPSRLVPGASGLQSQAFQRAQQMARRGSFGQQPQQGDDFRSLAMIAPQAAPVAPTQVPQSMIAQQVQQMQQNSPGMNLDPDLVRRYTTGY